MIDPECEYENYDEYCEIDSICKYEDAESHCSDMPEPEQPWCNEWDYEDDSCNQEWEDYQNAISEYEEEYNSCLVEYEQYCQEESEYQDSCIQEYEENCDQQREEYNSCQSCNQEWETYESSIEAYNNEYGEYYYDEFGYAEVYYGYWWDFDNNSFFAKYRNDLNYPYVYDANSKLYKYVNEYGEYLKNIGLKVIESRIPNGFELSNLPNIILDARKTYIWDYVENSINMEIAEAMTDEQIEEYSTDSIEEYFDYYNYSKLDKAKFLLFASDLSSEEMNIIASKLKIVSLTSYWLGNAISFNSVANIDSDGEVATGYLEDAWDFGTLNGIRPVVVVKRSDL